MGALLSLGGGDAGEDEPGVLKNLRLRDDAITEGKARISKAPANAVKAAPTDWAFIENALSKLLLFNHLEQSVQTKIVAEMYEWEVPAGEILIKEGDTGLGASELYVVKSGKFEVRENRQGVSMRVNLKERGDCFGELSLMYNCPRSATVAATTDATVWILDRDVFRFFVREGKKNETTQIELFLNSVPLLSSLNREEKLRLADALSRQTFGAGATVIKQGAPGDFFYIIKEGEAVVYQNSQKGLSKVNHLFKADFFGERALLCDEPRAASVEAITELTCLALNRETFVDILGPLEDLMRREKSPEVITTRMTQLETKAPSHVPAEVNVRRQKRSRNGTETWEMVRAKGHLDEVKELRKGGVKLGDDEQDGTGVLLLTEGHVLGGGAFSRVSVVTEETTGRTYAMKRMRKSGVVQCPEHVFCEQAITRNVAHPFCIRQYASFQDKYHLYFLFDQMSGGDLMDVLVAEAKVIKRRTAQGTWRRGCLAPKVKMLQGMQENLGRFYIGSVVLALEYLHAQNIVYRDLKPENVFLDDKGYVKLGDFGFAKVLDNGNRTYTFCGTPGYVAPENVLAHGYNYSVDWWGLGVLMYVLLTGRQPFSSPKTDDPMVVMRRIVDDNWHIKYPPYLSANAKDLIQRLLERKPARRLGMLNGRANDIKKHRFFEGFDWESLEARRMDPARKPKDDSMKRLKELAESEKRQHQRHKETPEEMRECDMVFAEF
ncbi:unnamed protein product [Ostreobium quekettii]|uniref:cGMP-dependent protein kinase n=1 Tax=Ostreobium quekettii TaxID=121088 RepID=A0A8S1JCM4_9CHLO|nr:unnamed protein product [Ostreobium quekettii]